jgi:hypothetical protein
MDVIIDRQGERDPGLRRDDWGHQPLHLGKANLNQATITNVTSNYTVLWLSKYVHPAVGRHDCRQDNSGRGSYDFSHRLRCTLWQVAGIQVSWDLSFVHPIPFLPYRQRQSRAPGS